MRVLLVDDMASMRKVLRQYLIEAGEAPGDILEAGDGFEALKLLDAERLRVDVILADWNMPNMDGLTFLKRVRALKGVKDIPVVMVTSQSQRAQVAEALRSGARDFIVKPFTSETLRRKLATYRGSSGETKAQDTSVALRSAAAAVASGGQGGFLDRIPPGAAEEFRKRARTMTHLGGDTIVAVGQPVGEFFLVQHGAVEVVPGGGAKAYQRKAGEPFCELEFLAGEASRVMVRAFSDVKVSSLPRAAFAELVTRFPDVGYLLSAMAGRQATPGKSGDPGGLAGRASTVPLSDLIQVFCATGKTGVLKLTLGSHEGEIGMERGEIRHAVTGGVEGEQAFYRMIAWTNASFSFDSKRRVEKTTITMPSMQLLMEGMRLLDERKKS